MTARRARSVARWLIANGVAAERLELLACGQRYVEDGPRSQTVRAQNRRVELAVSGHGAPTHDRCDPIALK